MEMILEDLCIEIILLEKIYKKKLNIEIVKI
jgi:hypothetical protein